jgi:FlaA1/EpsC-like NDP-sugar epimerase
MEQTVNPWKANLTNGVIFALIGVVYSLVIYFLDLSFNKMQGWIFLVVQIIILFFLVKSYRDNYRFGMITFGQALGAGLIIFVYYAVIMAVFTYLLYAVIDPELVDKQLAFAEEEMIKRGIPESAIEAGMKVQTKIMKPGIMAPLSIFGSMLQGLIMSLIVAAFVRKEGNPLIDTPEK